MADTPPVPPSKIVPSPPAVLHISTTYWTAGRVLHRIHPVEYASNAFNPGKKGNARFTEVPSKPKTLLVQSSWLSLGHFKISTRQISRGRLSSPLRHGYLSPSRTRVEPALVSFAPRQEESLFISA
jgi:hypothetical protein